MTPEEIQRLRERQNLDQMGQGWAHALNDTSRYDQLRQSKPLFDSVKIDKDKVTITGDASQLQSLLGSGAGPAGPHQQAIEQAGPAPTLGSGNEAIAAADAQGGVLGGLKGLFLRSGKAGGGFQNFDRRKGFGNLMNFLGAVPQGEAMYQQEKANFEDRMAGYKMRLTKLEEGLKDGALNRQVVAAEAERVRVQAKMTADEYARRTAPVSPDVLLDAYQIPDALRDPYKKFMAARNLSTSATGSQMTTQADFEDFVAMNKKVHDPKIQDDETRKYRDILVNMNTQRITMLEQKKNEIIDKDPLLLNEANKKLVNAYQGHINQLQADTNPMTTRGNTDLLERMEAGADNLQGIAMQTDVKKQLQADRLKYAALKASGALNTLEEKKFLSNDLLAKKKLVQNDPSDENMQLAYEAMRAWDDFNGGKQATPKRPENAVAPQGSLVAGKNKKQTMNLLRVQLKNSGMKATEEEISKRADELMWGQ